MPVDEWLGAINTWPKKMVKQNSKLALTNFYQWSIPALTAAVGTETPKVMSTCPGAGSCAGFCYAQQGGYGFKSAMVAHTRNLQAYLTDSKKWRTQIISEISSKKKLAAFRIHDSGDFFNRGYLAQWAEIARALPDVQFYAYTKMIPLVRRLGETPNNLTFIFSYGGKWDDQINEDTDRHSKVFSSHADLVAAGYWDTTESDANAADPTKLRVGLVYHGNSAFAGSAV
jgi:hypothetical protein